MIYVISYADGLPFENYQKFNALTAKLIGGADKVIRYSKEDISPDYIKEHAEIFKYKRGAGLWLWKSYFIKKTLDDIGEGDWLFYNDAGCFFVGAINKLIKHANKNNLSVMLFGLPLLNRQFCKHECFKQLGISDNNENQALGTYLLIRKNRKSMEFVNEWISLCECEEMISPNHFHPEVTEFSDFYSHREDQSLLSLLAIKHKIPLNVECSNYLIFPYLYCYKEFEYHPISRNTEKYGVILINHRASNPIRFYLSYIRMRILKSLGLKYTESQAILNPPSFSRNTRNKID